MSITCSFILFYKELSGTQSAAPTVKEFAINQLLTIRCAVVTNSFVASGPISSQIEWTRPPAPDPTTSFCSAPDRSYPFLIIIELSSLFFSPSLPFHISIVIFSGIIILMICLPVQSGYGLRIAGMGSSPGWSWLLPWLFPSLL